MNIFVLLPHREMIAYCNVVQGGTSPRSSDSHDKDDRNKFPCSNHKSICSDYKLKI